VNRNRVINFEFLLIEKLISFNTGIPLFRKRVFNLYFKILWILSTFYVKQRMKNKLFACYWYFWFYKNDRLPIASPLLCPMKIVSKSILQVNFADPIKCRCCNILFFMKYTYQMFKQPNKNNRLVVEIDTAWLHILLFISFWLRNLINTFKCTSKHSWRHKI